MFTSIVPKPRGKSSVGSISYFIARNMSIPPIAHITTYRQSSSSANSAKTKIA
ncbi:MAG: hypothetical protein ACLR56_08905 [Oscillospiraceae bacterium]